MVQCFKGRKGFPEDRVVSWMMFKLPSASQKTKPVAKDSAAKTLG